MEAGAVTKVVSDFASDAPGELSVQRGDVVQVLQRLDRIWCFGCCASTGLSGKVPSNNLMAIEIPALVPGQQLFVATADFAGQEAGDLFFTKGELIIGVRELDANWWQGQSGGRAGIFPTCYAWKLNSSSLQTKPMPQPMRRMARVIMPMKAQLDEEMDLIQGETVIIVESIDQDWYRGECGGRRGIFPAAYVSILDEPAQEDNQLPSYFDVVSQDSNFNSWNANKPVLPLNDAQCFNLSSPSLTFAVEKKKSDSTSDLMTFSPEKVAQKSSNLKDITEELDFLNDDYFKQNMPNLYTGSSDDEKQGTNKFALQHTNQHSVEYDIIPYGITLYPFYAQFDNELSFNEGEIVHLIHHIDRDWLKGEIEGKEGIFPGSYINIVIDCEPAQTHKILENTLEVAPRLEANCFAQVMFNFDTQMHGDLSVQANEIVLLVAAENEHWWRVRKQSGDTGLCPQNYLTPYHTRGSASPKPHHRLGGSMRSQSFSGQHSPLVATRSNEKVVLRDKVKMDRPSPPSSPPPEPPRAEEPQPSVECASSLAPRLPVKPSRLSRCGSDRTPHRPAPPVPMAGQVPVRRALKRPARHLSAPVGSTLLEQETEDPNSATSTHAQEDTEQNTRHRKSEQRQNVISELASTEKEYIRDLKITYETFNLHNPQHLEARGIDANILFGNILEVMHVAETLLDKILLSMKGKSEEDQEIAPSFLDMADELRTVYGQYCMNHEHALALLEKYETDQDVQRLFQKGLETLRHQIACFDMSSILIKPVQRIMKYPLILNELVKCTEDEHKDKVGLLMAVRTMSQVASYINECKRRKDIVSKYLEDGNTSLSTRMSRISLHSMAKISTRLGAKLTSSLGMGPNIKDPSFEEQERMFHTVERTIRTFLKNVETFVGNLYDVVSAQFQCAEAIVDFYDEKKEAANVNEFRTVQHTLISEVFSDFKASIESRVVYPLGSVLELTEGPSKLIQKRHDKLLDYESCLSKTDKNKDSRLQEDLKLARSTYEALNSQLLEELPTLSDVAAHIHRDCIAAFLTARKLFSARLTKHYLELMQLPLMANCGGDVLENFKGKQNSVCSEMGNLSFTSKYFKLDNVNKRLSKSPNLSVTGDQKAVVLQSASQRAYLQSRYRAEQLYTVREPHLACETLELSVAQGHLVAVLKQQDPMGRSERWFVHDGENQGFLPSKCLEPAYGGAENVSKQCPVNSKSPSAYQEPPLPPPSYEEVARSRTPDTAAAAIYEEIPSPSAQQHLYEEIPEAGFYFATYDFHSLGEHMLTLKKGQIVKVLQMHDVQGNPEWWLVEDRFGVQGYVPGNYLSIYE